MSMNVKDLTQCSQDQQPEVIFFFGATSTMVSRNSMHTTTWLFEQTTFALKIDQDGRGAKARSRSQRRYEPPSKIIWELETTENIMHSLSEFSKLVYYFI